jgi:hypothetical protein
MLSCLIISLITLLYPLQQTLSCLLTSQPAAKWVTYWSLLLPLLFLQDLLPCMGTSWSVMQAALALWLYSEEFCGYRVVYGGVVARGVQALGGVEGVLGAVPGLGLGKVKHE